MGDKDKVVQERFIDPFNITAVFGFTDQVNKRNICYEYHNSSSEVWAPFVLVGLVIQNKQYSILFLFWGECTFVWFVR